jgi:hypothetical protein
VTSAVDAVDDSASIAEDAPPATFNVLTNDSGPIAITDIGPITVRGPSAAGLDLSDVNITGVGGSLRVELGSDFGKLTDGQLAFVDIPYLATDGSASDTATLHLTVTGKTGPVTAPVDLDPADNFVLENSPIGTLVGVTARSFNPDVGGTVTYRLVTSPGQSTPFAIDPTNRRDHCCGTARRRFSPRLADHRRGRGGI